MGFGTFVIAVLFVIVVLPLWLVFHYVTKWRSARALTDEHEHVLGQLWESAGRMEARIATLERLLDVEAPGWRARSPGGL